jgi:tetratricopeptide (TPR) repeat protein
MIYRAMLVAVLLFTGMAINVSAQSNEAVEHFKKAELLYRNFDYADAIPYYDMAIKADQSQAKYYLQRGFCKNIIMDFEGAKEDFSAVIELAPGNGFAYVSRGSAKNKLKEYESAITDFDKAIEIDPKDMEAYNNRGFSKKKLGDKKGACADWKTSKKLGNEEAKIILKNNYCK